MSGKIRCIDAKLMFACGLLWTHLSYDLLRQWETNPNLESGPNEDRIKTNCYQNWTESRPNWDLIGTESSPNQAQNGVELGLN